MKKLSTILLAALLMLSLVACSSSSDDESDDASTIHIAMTTAPVGLHPLKTNDTPSATVTVQMFETLYMRSYDGTSYEPLLAAEMPEYSDDGLTATIYLRDDVYFHDGTKFTSDAVAYMIDSIKDADYGAMRTSIVESIDSYTIVDEYTIQLHLAYVDGVLIAKLAHSNASIINPEVDQSQDLLVDPSGAGTGPYVYSSSVTGSTYTLVANEDYWGGEPEIETIVFEIVADESTVVARLQTGEADFFTGVTTNTLSTVEAISGYTVVNQENSSVTYLALRSTADTAANPLMENIDFRIAIIEAIDFDTYVETMLSGTASRSQSIVGPTLVGYTEAMEEAGYTYDQEHALSIIQENGWEGETVTVLISTSSSYTNLATYIQSELAEIGLNVEISAQEYATYLTTSSDDQGFDIIILGWSNVTGDGQQMLEPNFSTANGTRVKYNNAEFDEIVQNSAWTTDLAERQAYMLEAVLMIQGDAIVTPAYSSNTIYVYDSEKYANVVLDASGLYYVKDFTIVTSE